MNINNIKELANFYKDQLSDESKDDTLEHLRWMCGEIAKFDDIYKANRWLGFVQGVLFMKGIFNIDEMREHVRKSKKVALILVDLQNDFFEGGALAVSNSGEIIDVCNKLINSSFFDFIVATKDWHPSDHGSFVDNHRRANVGNIINLGGISQILWPRHCVQNTEGAEFHPALQIPPSVRQIHKGTDPLLDSYSGFFDNGYRNKTDLDELLHELGVEEVHICGLATDYCVKFTALDAVKLGYRTYLIPDACRGVNLQPGDVDKALEEMAAEGVVLNSLDRYFETS